MRLNLGAGGLSGQRKPEEKLISDRFCHERRMRDGRSSAQVFPVEPYYARIGFLSFNF